MGKYLLYYVNKKNEDEWELEEAQIPFELMDKLRKEFNNKQLTREGIQEFLLKNKDYKKNKNG